MKKDDIRWKIIQNELEQIRIDRIDDNMVYYHYIKEDSVQCWSEYDIIENMSFETQSEAILKHIHNLEAKRDKIDDEIDIMRQKYFDTYFQQTLNTSDD